MDDRDVMPHGNSTLRSVERSFFDVAKPCTSTRPYLSVFPTNPLHIHRRAYRRTCLSIYFPFLRVSQSTFCRMCWMDAEGRQLHLAELFLQIVETRRLFFSRG